MRWIPEIVLSIGASSVIAGSLLTFAPGTALLYIGGYMTTIAVIMAVKR
jgi:hypothetical protein